MVSQAAIPEVLDRGRLRRRVEHRLIAGVAGGLADWLNAPVAFIRFFIVIAWTWAPWTVAIYAAAALLVPAGGRDRPDWDNLVAGARLGLVFAVPWLTGPTLYLDEGLGGPPGWWIAWFALPAVGAAMLMSADYRRGRGRSSEEARAAVAAAVPVATCVILLAAAMALATEVRWERFVPLVALGGAAALLAAPRREYVAPAMLALGVAVVVVASGARLEGGVGDLRLSASDARDGRIVARRAVGDVVVDLRRLRGRSISLVASAGRGDVTVRVPRRAHLELVADVGVGRIERLVFDEEAVQGFDRRLADDVAGRRGRGRVRVEAEVGVGNIDVDRYGP